MAKTNAENQRDYRKRMKEKGYKQRSFYVKPSWVKHFVQLIKELEEKEND